MPTVVQLSDSHLARVRSEAPDGPDAGLERAVRAVAGSAPELVLLTGDIADDGTDEAYARVREMIAPLRASVLATPGNHDDRAAVAAAFSGAVEVQLGAWRIVAHDTTIVDEIHGRVDVTALLDLLGRDDGVPTLLALHHPPITISTHPWFQTHGGGRLVGMLADRSDVRVVLSGHLHQPFHVVSGNVSYLGAPSTWYAIEHHGAEFTTGVGEVGAVELELRDDGTWNSRLITC
jgi:Icc protein